MQVAQLIMERRNLNINQLSFDCIRRQSTSITTQPEQHSKSDARATSRVKGEAIETLPTRLAGMRLTTDVQCANVHYTIS